MNIIALTGNATKDVELKYGQAGTAIGSGTIAVRRDFKNKQTDEYETDFINFTSFGKQAEIMANHIKKGDKFGINGRLQIRTWDDDQGRRQYFTEVVVSGFDFPDKKKDTSQNTSSGQPNTQQQQSYTNAQNQQQNSYSRQQGASYGNQQQQQYQQPQQQQNYQRADQDPFINGGGPVEVDGDDLPF